MTEKKTIQSEFITFSKVFSNKLFWRLAVWRVPYSECCYNFFDE